MPRGLSASDVGPYSEDNLAATNTPLVALVFRGLSLLPYNFGLTVYLATFVVAFIVMLVAGGRKLDFLRGSLLVVFGGLLSLGFISAMDRGNHAALMGPLLAGLVLTRSRWIAIVCMVLLLSLKVWGVVFLIVLLSRRQWREAAISCVAACILAIVSLILLGPSLWDGIRISFSMWLSSEVAEGVFFYSVSLVGMIKKVSCSVGPAPLCPISEEASPLLSVGLALLILVPALAVALRAAWNFAWPYWMRYAPLVGLIVVALPEAATYVLVLVPALTTMMAFTSSDSWYEGSVRVRSLMSTMQQCVLCVAVAASTVPFVAWWSVESPGGMLLFLRPAYLLVPVAWALVMLAFAIVQVRDLVEPERARQKRRARVP